MKGAMVLKVEFVISDKQLINNDGVQSPQWFLQRMAERAEEDNEELKGQLDELMGMVNDQYFSGEKVITGFELSVVESS